MRAYNEWRAAEHLRRQASCCFGTGSDEEAAMERVVRFWFSAWTDEGCTVVHPPPDVTKSLIDDAQRSMKRYARLEDRTIEPDPSVFRVPSEEETRAFTDGTYKWDSQRFRWVRID